MSTSSRRLAEDIYSIERLARDHATTPQMEATSVGRMDFHDGDGSPQGNIRPDRDGGLRIEWGDGPQPPPPSTPTVTSDMGFVRVRWNGMFGDPLNSGVPVDPDVLATHDIHVVEVHLSMDPLAEPDRVETFAGTFDATAGGGDTAVGPLGEAGEYWCFLVSRSRSGKRSNPSGRVAIQVTVNSMESELLGLALRAEEAMDSADERNKVYYGDAPPEPKPRLDEDGNPMFDEDGNPLFYPFSEGDIWFGEGNMPHVYSDSDGDWVSARDQRILELAAHMDDFEGDLDSVRESADGKSRTFYRPTEPPAAESSEGDLWFDTSAEGGNAAHRFTDGAWVSVADQRVQAVQDAMADFESDLNTVRDTADGKNRTYYQSTMPATPPARAGDLWFNTANGYRLHRHNGATFIEVADGRIAEVESAVENIDISGPLSEARTEWLADAAADAQTKAQNAAAAAEAAAKLYADAVATGAVEGELEGIQDYADQAADAARQAAIDAAIAEARVIANAARDEALAAALDADAVISQTIAQFESDLDVVRQSADGKSKITWSPNTPSGEGRAGDTWFRTSGNNIIGHWRHSGSAWVSMSLDATVIPNLDAGKITSGYIDAERIKAGSIAADKLVVGGSTNVVPDPTFSNPEVSARRVANSTGYGGEWSIADGMVTLDPKDGLTSNPNLNLAPVSDRYAWAPEPGVQVVAKFQARVRSGEAQVRGTTYVRKRDGVTRYVSMVPGWTSLSQDWAELTFTYSMAPDDVGYTFAFQALGSSVTGIVDFRLPFVSPLVGSTLIEDGTVTADKIQAGAVGATAIAAESIDASKIVAGGIQADSLIVPGTVGSTLIKDGAITTSKIEAGAITAQSGIIASLDAGVISSGTIDTARLAAGSITADKIAIGDFDNLALIDPIRNVNVTYPGSWATVTTDDGYITAAPSADRFYLMFRDRSNNPPIKGGDRLLFEFRAKATAPGVRGRAHLWTYLGPAGAPGATAGSAAGEIVAFAEEDTFYSLPLTIPAGVGDGARAWAIGLLTTNASNSHDLSVRDVRVRRMTGSTLIEPGAITTEKIATGAITAESGVIGSLDAGKITVGEMDGVRIKAGTVDAGKLRVGSESNFLPAGVIASESDLELWPGDPSFRDGGGSARGGAAVYPRGHGTVQFDSMGSFSVAPGDIIAFEIWVASLYEDSMIYAEVRDQNDERLGGWGALPGLEFVGDTSYPVSAEVVGGGWRGFGAKATVPDGVNRISLYRLYLNHPDGPSRNGEVWLSGLRLYRLTGSTLIADGAITTDKIATGAITAESGIVGSLDAGVITTGELRGELIRAQSIAASALAADAIDGKTITGATIRTASAGTRVEITGSGLRQYNSNSQVVTEMAAGRFSAVGSLTTGFNGERRIEISNEVWGNGAGMMFVPGARTVSPSMKQFESRLGSPRQGHIEMASAETPGGTRARIMLQDTSGVDLVSRKLSSGGYSETGAFGRMTLDHRSGVVLGSGQSGNGWGEYIALLHSDAPTNHWTGGEPGGVKIRSSIVDIEATKGFRLRSNDGIQLTSFSSQQQKFIRFWDESGDGWSTLRGEIGETSSRLKVNGNLGLDIQGYGADMRFDYDGKGVVSSQAILHRTTSSSGNVHMNTSGVLFRGTSARKYKADERSIPVEEYADALLSIDFKAWRDRSEVEGAERLREWRDENPMQPVPYSMSAFTDEPAEYVGAVADDFHDAGLGSLVVYDEYGQVEGLMYERIGPALIPVVRELRDRVIELEAQLGVK